MADVMDLAGRKDLYKQNKEDADDAFYANNYAEAAKLYQSCINCINSLPKKLERTEDDNNNLRDLIRTCQCNFVICVVKGPLVAEQEKARVIINLLAQVTPTAKIFYLQGKLMLQMKYLSNAKDALRKSYELEVNDKTLNLLKSIKEERSEKEVYKHIIENLEAERVRESKERKREAKDDWFRAAELEEEKKLILETFLAGGSESELNSADLDKLCRTLE